MRTFKTVYKIAFAFVLAISADNITLESSAISY